MGSGISSTQFFVYGKINFTRTGYLKHVKGYTSPRQARADIKVGEEGADGVNLGGKVIVITGANSGVGKEMAMYAAAKGADVYMVCRSMGRAETARDEIIKKTSSDKVKILQADVGDLEQVRQLVKELQNMEDRVDCLVCNAGALLNDRKETKEGNEVTIATHLLGGTYLLSSLLMPQLKKSGKEARIMFIGSGGMYNSKFPSWSIATSTDPGYKYNGNMAYAYAKRGQLLLSERWGKEHPELSIVTGHPGWTMTPGLDAAYGSVKRLFEPLRSPWEGAEPLTWLMSTPSKDLESGAFYTDRKKDRKHLGGPFMTEGSYTKNKQSEVDTMMENLKRACGL